MLNPEMEPPEPTPRLQGFSDSAKLAFHTLDTMTDEGLQQGAFFRISWSKEDLTTIDRLQVFSTEPTGALRQEHNGRFYSGQFVVTLRDATDSSQQPDKTLQWLDIDPVLPGEVLVVDSELVENQHQFQVLTPESIVKNLLPKAKTTEDHAALIRHCKERNVNDLKTIFQSVRITALRLIDQQVYYTESDNPIEAQRYFELIVNYINMLKGIDNDEMTNLQSRLLSRVLNNLPRTWHTRADARGEAALDTLESGIENGLFPADKSIMDRIYAIPATYTRPSLVERLHTYVMSKQFNEKGYNFTKIHRENFTHDFMFSILASRLIELKGSNAASVQKVRKLVEETNSLREDKKGSLDFSPLVQLAKELGRKPKELPESQVGLEQAILEAKYESIRPTNQRITIDEVYKVNNHKVMNSPHTLRETAESFEYILEKLSQERDSSDSPIRALDQQAIDITWRMFKSVIQRQYGYRLVQIFLAQQSKDIPHSSSNE